MAADMAFRVGVDLGGTKTAIAVLDRANETIYAARRDTPSHDYDAIIRAIRELVDGARAALCFGAEVAVGVGIPGALAADDATVKNANTQTLIGRPLTRDLERALGARVAVANDAACFIASEAADGAAAGAEVAFGVILGTGVGGGVAVNGAPLIGRNRLNGEWGHNPFPLYGRPPITERCYCGKIGCVEQVLSGPALAAAYRAETGEALTGREIAAKAESAREYGRCYIVFLLRASATGKNVLP
ncbi:MAG: ROK family protein [Pseudomonadota bacterium]